MSIIEYADNMLKDKKFPSEELRILTRNYLIRNFRNINNQSKDIIFKNLNSNN